ncbi:hypothetical protein ABTX99_36110 [Streptomyces flaveolus]|uniref:hypothetical protein n=1 Tax=Streptomyces flaveolus TaxID=67297 RepID=UPI003331549C
MYREEVLLPVEEMCGVRFVPAGLPPFPRHVAVYRINHPRGVPLNYVQDERYRWVETERVFLGALSAALEELHQAHGGRGAILNLYAGSQRWNQLSAPLPLPGWRRRIAARSAAAQYVFPERLEQAERAYRPVREEIERRIEEHLTAERAAERADARARQEAYQRRREAFLEVARQRVWSYAVVTVKQRPAVLAYRLDVTPAHPLPKPSRPRVRPLNAAKLEAALLKALRDGELSGVRWDPQARAAVEQECRERGEQTIFEHWWQDVSKHWWEEVPGKYWNAPDSRPPGHDSSRHSRHAGDGRYGGSFGDGCSGGFGGGFRAGASGGAVSRRFRPTRRAHRHVH